MGYINSLGNALQQYKSDNMQGAVYGLAFSSIFYWGGMGLSKVMTPSENLIFQVYTTPFELIVNNSFN